MPLTIEEKRKAMKNICEFHLPLVRALFAQQKMEKAQRRVLDAMNMRGKNGFASTLNRSIRIRSLRLAELEIRRDGESNKCAACDLIEQYSSFPLFKKNVLTERLPSSIVERLPRKQEAVGAIPAGGSKFNALNY